VIRKGTGVAGEGFVRDAKQLELAKYQDREIRIVEDF